MPDPTHAPPSQWPIYAGAAVTIASLFALLIIPIRSERTTASLRREMEVRIEPAWEAIEEFELALAREASSIRGYLLIGDDPILQRYFLRQQETNQVLEQLDSLAGPMGEGFARHLSVMNEELRAWRMPYEGVAAGRLSRESAASILREHQDHYEGAVQAAMALTASADSAANVYRGRIRQAEWNGNVLTITLALLTLLSVGVVLWFAWRIQRLADSLRKTVEKEEELRMVAEAAVRSRDEVLAIVSHDLRNPLSSISLGAHLLASDAPAAIRASQVESIQRLVARMNRLINDLLDINRLEAGNHLTIQPRNVDVAPLLDELAEVFRQQVQEKSIHLACHVERDGLTVYADQDRLFQALSNLVGNAVKFTPEGGSVTVCAALSTDTVVFAVQDTGPGISDGDIERVFDPYWQVGRTARLGTGLGLPIARGIAEAHGGRVQVKSRPGEGSTFLLEVPVGRHELFQV